MAEEPQNTELLPFSAGESICALVWLPTFCALALLLDYFSPYWKLLHLLTGVVCLTGSLIAASYILLNLRRLLGDTLDWSLKRRMLCTVLCIIGGPMFCHCLIVAVAQKKHRKVTAGCAGPAGMFASLILAEYGYRPLVLERGASVSRRIEAVRKFTEEGVLDTDTNVQFGAGGAGTFSDGKLTTRIGDPFVHSVLSLFHEMGAPRSVLTKAKPHIGSDILRVIVENFHKKIESLGGEIRYGVKVTGVFDGHVETTDGTIPCGAAVIAAGHSARDLYFSLRDGGYAMEAKPFSAGVRIEHLTRDIDRAMYGDESLSDVIGHAEYSLSLRMGERGVYSFCMCPGGTVIASSSEEGGVVTNGMSLSDRGGVNSNSALAVSVLPKDFGGDFTSAIEFQRELERRAFLAGGGNFHAPCQTVKDFIDGKRGGVGGRVAPTYMNGKVTPCDLNKIFPEFISSMLKTGIRDFGRKIKGFDGDDVPLTGVETRTSAPVRILRGEDHLALSHSKVYPCGEGAGYAGGIVSAAVDGIRVAGSIITKYSPDKIPEE